MSTPFSDDEVIRRTARRLGTNETNVRNWLQAYCDEWLTHAQETGHGQYAVVEPVAKAPAKAAGKARSPRKATPKVRTPAKGKATAQGESTGEALGNAMVKAAMRREAEASVNLDGETHVVGEPMNSSDTTTPNVPGWHLAAATQGIPGDGQEEPAGSPS